MKLTQYQCTGAYIEHRYIERLTERVARLLGIENLEKLRNFNDSMNSEYHPYTSDTPLLANNNISNYNIPIVRGFSPDLSLKLCFNYFRAYQFPPRKSTRNRQTSLNTNVEKSLKP